MPVGVGSIARREAHATMPCGQDENGNEQILNLWHDPSSFTPEFEALIREGMDDQVQSRFLVRCIHAILKRWDLVAVEDEDAELYGVEVGDAIPITEECLSKLPIAFLIEVSKAIQGDNSPGKSPKKPARSGSFS